jgi:hypothetical protein
MDKEDVLKPNSGILFGHEKNEVMICATESVILGSIMLNERCLAGAPFGHDVKVP